MFLWCVDVPNYFNLSRFSPVTIACLTLSATVGVALPVQAESLRDTNIRETNIHDVQGQVDAALLGAEAGDWLATQENALPTNQEHASITYDVSEGSAAIASPSPRFASLISTPEVIPPENSGASLLAQIEVEEPAPNIPEPSTPPPATQTPEGGTPDVIDVELPFDSPEVEVDGPEVESPDSEIIPEAEEEVPVLPQPPTPTTTEEPRVLVAEVAVEGVDGELQRIVYDAIETQPGRTTTRSQLQEDINSVFATGFFTNVQVTPEDTPLGVRVRFTVDPNPVLTQVRLSDPMVDTLIVDDQEVPIQEAVDDIFAPQYGEILNFRDLQFGVQELNTLYQDNGYVLAQVVDAPQVSDDGVITLIVAEGVIEDIEVRFLDEEGNDVDEDGEPIDGQTRDFIITREFESQPGDVFNQSQIQQDLQRVFGLGIFEDVRISLDPGDDPSKVDVVVNVTERNTGSIAAGLGFSSSTGVFGTVSFQEQNLGGNNQRVGAEVQVNFRDLLFDVSFTDPWIATDPYRTSYTINAFSRRSISSIFDGGDTEVELPNGDRPRVRRLGGGLSFSRPLDEWLGWENWRANLGFEYQNVSIRDSDGELSPFDELGNQLAISDDGVDDLYLIQLGLTNDRRNSVLTPTSGSVLRLRTEQSIPLGSGSIAFNRLRASYSFYLPVRFLSFTSGCRLDDPSPSDCPQALAFNVQGGTVIGDLPPYEAFALGGTDSVRGYDFGEVGSGRSYVQATMEYRFPVVSIVGGALFVDFASDLGTGEDVQGDPAGIRDKPGTGLGFGGGIRIQSPLGQIRVDYGFNDEGDSRIHFGIGERF
jgi:outer membrane protein insertion porin family